MLQATRSLTLPAALSALQWEAVEKSAWNGRDEAASKNKQTDRERESENAPAVSKCAVHFAFGLARRIDDRDQVKGN